MKKRFIFPILISLIIVVLVFGNVFRLNQISKIVLDNENNIVQAQGPGELKPYKNKWLSSYETICFDTADGDLDKKQYALDEGGNGYYIRTKSKDESQFEWKDLSYDVSKLEKVNVVAGAHCYYDEFLTAKGAEAIWGEEKKEMPKGGIIRIQSTAKKYWDTAKIKNHPQPERIEMVEELPPPEPPQPHNKPQSIALDAASNSGPEAHVSSYSWNHTTGSGDNRLLVVGHSHDIADTIEGPIEVSSITYNSVPLGIIRTDVIPHAYTAIAYLVAPASGAKTITITLNSEMYDGMGGAISYTGAAQTGQPDAHNGATGDSNKPSVNVTTVADGSWVISVVSSWYGELSSNNTMRWSLIGEYYGGSDTNGPKTPAGSQTMSWDAGDDEWAISAASFAPAEEAPSLTLTVDSPTKSLGNITPGTPVTATTTTTVTTGDSKGYSLKISDSVAGSDSALLHSDTATRIADYSGIIASPTLWSEGATGLGICVYAADTSKEAKWGTGTTETDSNNKYAGIPQTATEIHNVGSAVTDDDTYIGYKLDAPSSQKTGTYSGDVTYTAVVNP